VDLPKQAGVYQGEKRRRELARQKKLEERRQRWFHKGDRPFPVTENAEKIE